MKITELEKKVADLELQVSDFEEDSEDMDFSIGAPAANSGEGSEDDQRVLEFKKALAEISQQNEILKEQTIKQAQTINFPCSCDHWHPSKTK